MLDRKYSIFLLLMGIGVFFYADSKADQMTFYGTSGTYGSWDSQKYYERQLIEAKARKFTEKDARDMETKLEKEPADMDERIELLTYYSSKSENKSFRKFFAKQVLWFIENHPEDELLGSGYGNLTSSQDGEAFENAKELWLGQAGKYKNNPIVLYNAATFFEWNDRDKTGDLLKKCAALEPDNPAWHNHLGTFYGNQMQREEGDEKKAMAKKSLEEFEKAINCTKKAGEKTGFLADAAEVAVEVGDMGKAKKYAGELIDETEADGGFNSGDYIRLGNMVLGKAALASGDLKKAGEYLVTAGKIPIYGFFGNLDEKDMKSSAMGSYRFPDTDLAKGLLEKGEKDSAIQYFQDCSKTHKHHEALLKKWIDLIRQGKKPDFGEKRLNRAK